MKKVMMLFFIIFLFPLNIFAYSKYLIPGGESIGIQIETDGLIVVGFYKVDGEYIAKNNIKIGDQIIKINNKEVFSIDELTNVIDSSIIENKKIDIELKRNNKIIQTTLDIKEEYGKYKTGLYVKDSVIGLGTLTYIDPVTKIYGALGHEIVLSSTKKIVEVRDGNILLSKVKGIDKSRNGYVGSKEADISFDNKLGKISKNTIKGIYGEYTSKLPNKQKIEICEFNEIEKTDAYILTVTSENEIKKYNIKIVDIYPNKIDTQKSFSFEIVDKELLNKTGGIVQGMSGSPIIQNNKIIGAVTNVLVDNVELGYGIYIKTMLEEGEKN